MQDRTGRVPRVYHTLDGLRGIAALAVVGYHSWGSALHNLLPRAYLAVDLFFIMSGVVIAAAYDDRIARGLGTAGFMAARLRRLYPLYLLATAIGIAGAAYAGKPLAAWPYALAMLPAPGGQRLYPFDGAAWSLFFELAANLVFVALHPRLTTRVLAAVVAVSAVLLAALEISGGWLNYGYAWFCFTPGIARVGFGFFGGVLLSRLALPVMRAPVWAFAAVPLLLAAVAPAGYGIDLAIVVVAWPIVVWLAMGNEPRRHGACTLLGGVSYALYILHQPVLTWLETAERHGFGPHRPYSLGLGLLVLGGLFGVAWTAQRHFDTPVRAWLARPRYAVPNPV